MKTQIAKMQWLYYSAFSQKVNSRIKSNVWEITNKKGGVFFCK